MAFAFDENLAGRSQYDEDDEDFDSEEIEMERKDNIRRVAKEMLLIERAKEWLLGDDGR